MFLSQFLVVRSTSEGFYNQKLGIFVSWTYKFSANSWWWEVLQRGRDHPNVRLQGRRTGSEEITMKGPKRKTIPKSGKNLDSSKKWWKTQIWLTFFMVPGGRDPTGDACRDALPGGKGGAFHNWVISSQWWDTHCVLHRWGTDLQTHLARQSTNSTLATIDGTLDLRYPQFETSSTNFWLLTIEGSLNYLRHLFTGLDWFSVICIFLY